LQLIDKKINEAACFRVSPQQVRELLAMFPNPEGTAVMLDISEEPLINAENDPESQINFRTLIEYRARIRDLVQQKLKNLRHCCGSVLSAALEVPTCAGGAHVKSKLHRKSKR
jgi:hypothetical protein